MAELAERRAKIEAEENLLESSFDAPSRHPEAEFSPNPALVE